MHLSYPCSSLVHKWEIKWTFQTLQVSLGLDAGDGSFTLNSISVQIREGLPTGHEHRLSIPFGSCPLVPRYLEYNLCKERPAY